MNCCVCTMIKVVARLAGILFVNMNATKAVKLKEQSHGVEIQYSFTTYETIVTDLDYLPHLRTNV